MIIGTDTAVAIDHPTGEELAGHVEDIAAAPTDRGTLELIVRRPDVDQREVLDAGRLDLAEGLAGDSWSVRASRRTPDGSAHPDMQLNVISARVLSAITRGDRSRWHLAGDQLIVDLDLAPDNLPAGTRLAIGEEAVIEVTDQPHTGCPKFAARFGAEALRFVNTGDGKARRYRGLNAKVVSPGTIRPGDQVVKR